MAYLIRTHGVKIRTNKKVDPHSHKHTHTKARESKIIPWWRVTEHTNLFSVRAIFGHINNSAIELNK